LIRPHGCLCGGTSRVARRTAVVDATDTADDGEPNSGGDATATPTPTPTALSVSAPPEPRPDPRPAALAGLGVPTGAHWAASLGATGGSCRSAAVGTTDVRIGRHRSEGTRSTHGLAKARAVCNRGMHSAVGECRDPMRPPPCGRCLAAIADSTAHSPPGEGARGGRRYAAAPAAGMVLGRCIAGAAVPARTVCTCRLHAHRHTSGLLRHIDPRTVRGRG
jgi:hypothetical protein